MSRFVRLALLIPALFTFLLSLAPADAAHAQAPTKYPPLPPDSSKFLVFNGVTMGPYFTAGVSRMNEKIPDGWHSKPSFSYAFGGLGYLDLTSYLGITLGASYDSRDLFMSTKDDSTSMDLSIDYFSIQPSIRIFWLMVGLSFDIPMAGSATETIARYDHPDQEPAQYLQNRSVDTKDLSTLTELRAQLSIPILKVESGTIHLLVGGSYPLSKTVASTSSYDSTGHFTSANGTPLIGQGPLPSVQAGLTFQFDLLH